MGNEKVENTEAKSNKVFIAFNDSQAFAQKKNWVLRTPYAKRIRTHVARFRTFLF